MKSAIVTNSVRSIWIAACALVALAAHGTTAQARDTGQLCSPASNDALEVEFVNHSSQTVSFHWMQGDCSEGGGPVVLPGQREKGMTYAGHIFRVRNETSQLVTAFTASPTHRAFVVDNKAVKAATGPEKYTESTCSKTISPAQLSVEFVNHLNEPIVAQWVGFDCKLNHFLDIPAHATRKLTSYEGHVFRFIDSERLQLRALDISPEETTYRITAD